VGGRFELMARLGSGGMGTVWRARDLELHREVAIKEVRPADAALYENDPSLAAQQRERVMRESRALARLQHPNVVSIYQIVEMEGSPYPWIVMELVRGTSLEDRLRQGPLPPHEAARIGRGVLGALRAAHEAGIHHRDVKPGNVLLRQDGSAVLTDFGIAALRDSTTLTATGEVIGSPEYIAPERLHGDETRTASDFWSLAMLLYVAVEGYHPLRRSSTMATLAAVMTEPVPPPRQAGPLSAMLSAVLVPDPAARPNGAQLDQLLAAAEAGVGAPVAPPQYQQYQQVPGPPSHPFPAPAATTGPVPGRRRAIAISLSALAVILAAAVVAMIVWYRPDGGADAGSGDTGSTEANPQTDVAAPTQVDVPSVTAAPTGASPQDLTTPAGARAAVAALSKEMRGSKVSDLVLYPDYATATAPTLDGPENGFDNFEYRGGDAATRVDADGVDADRAVLDLNSVNWDALPRLWKRADKELGVDKPTLRYVNLSTDIIDGTASMNFYLTNDYGGGYLHANLEGEVIDVYPLE
jgi:tRNA A-37 threonylcarbamoyl transferase component Bud32